MTKSLRESFGRALKNIRNSKAMTQSDLAQRADISVDYLSKIERGFSSPAFEKIEQLADGLGVNPGDIFLVSSLLSENPEYDTGSYREVFNNTPEPMLLWTVNNGNSAGHILDANSAAQELTGYPIQELREATPIQLLSLGDQGLARTRVRNHSGNSARNLRYTLTNKNGQEIPIIASTKYFKMGEQHMGLTEIQRYPAPLHPMSDRERRNVFTGCISNNACMEHISDSIIAPLQTARALLDDDMASPERAAMCREMLDEALARAQRISTLNTLARTAPELAETLPLNDILHMVRDETARRYPGRHFVTHVHDQLANDVQMPAEHIKHVLCELTELFLRHGSREIQFTFKPGIPLDRTEQQWIEARIDAFGSCMSNQTLRVLAASVGGNCRECRGEKAKPDMGLCLAQTMIQLMGGSIQLNRKEEDGARITVLIPLKDHG